MAEKTTHIIQESKARAQEIMLNEIDKGPAHIRTYVNTTAQIRLKKIR